MSNPLIKIENVHKEIDGREILNAISFNVNSGEFLTLLGPSGCGKTTLLRLISGFSMPTSGNICINGQKINHLSPQKRDVHTVFQSYALFPHLSVKQNIAFPLTCQKVAKDVINERVEEVLNLIRLQDYANSGISSLSGGQQQRVAIARAIINRPKLLLLDEPLSSLDYRLRQAMQYELKQLQKKLDMTFVFVTHDQDEALSLSDRIVVFNNGRIEQIGTPREVYENPNNLFVAKFIGETNIFDVEVASTKDNTFETIIENMSVTCNNNSNFHKSDRIHLIVRPEDIRVYHQDEIEDTTNMLSGIVIDIVYKGTTVDLKVKLPSGHIINASEFFNEDDNDLEFTLNETVWIHWLTGWEVNLPYEK